MTLSCVPVLHWQLMKTNSNAKTCKSITSREFMHTNYSPPKQEAAAANHCGFIIHQVVLISIWAKLSGKRREGGYSLCGGHLIHSTCMGRHPRYPFILSIDFPKHSLCVRWCFLTLDMISCISGYKFMVNNNVRKNMMLTLNYAFIQYVLKVVKMR